MKRLYKRIAFIAVMAVMALGANAGSSISIGVSPYGFNDVRFTSGNGKCEFKYTKQLAANLAYEWQKSSFSMLVEADMSKSSLKLDGIKKISDNFSDKMIKGLLDKDLYTYSADIYFGYVLFAKKRVQLPLYVGIGGSWMHHDDLYDLGTVNFAAKARVKFYFAYKWAIYAGATYKYGLMIPGKNHSYINDSDSPHYGALTLDAGVVFSF